MKASLSCLYYIIFIAIVVLLYNLFTERARKELFVPIDNPLFNSELKIEKNPRISCKVGDESVEVSWNASLSNVINYFIKIEELNSKNPNLMLHVVPDPNCKQCYRKITGLKNGVPYVVTLHTKTDKKNIVSNPVSIMPNGPIKTYEISDILLKSDKEIEESIGSVDVPCAYLKEKSNQYHNLDENYESIYDLMK